MTFISETNDAPFISTAGPGDFLELLKPRVMSLVVYTAIAGMLIAAPGLNFVYSMWLKRSTPQNIVIGGAAGAFPPLVAYAAVTGTVSWSSLALFALIFIWTPPHFWALALVKSEEYAMAGIPMLPNVKGADRTRRDILLYTLVLAPVGVLPYMMGFATIGYGALSVALGLAILYLAWRVYRIRIGEAANKAAIGLFSFSILYLFLLFAEIIGERTLMIANVVPWP